MTEKLLIYQSLVDKFPSFVREMERLGLEILAAVDSDEVLRKAEEHHPGVVILDVGMEGVGGMECCRRLKHPAVDGFSPKVVLVAAFRSPVAESRAREAGCDLLFLAGEPDSKLTDFVISSVAIPLQGGAKPASEFSFEAHTIPVEPPKAEENIATQVLGEPGYLLPQQVQRISPRIDIPGVMSYTVGGREKTGWSINSSRTGILFAVDEEYPLGTEAVLRFSLPDGSQFELPVSIVRILKLRLPVNSLPFGVGAKFGFLTEIQIDKLSQLMESRSLALASRIKSGFLEKVFRNAEDVVNEALGTEEIPQELILYLEEIRPFEHEAFASDGLVQQCVRSLVGMRVQCTAFRVFLPSLRANPMILGPTYFPILSTILEKADAIESDVDILVRDAVTRGDDATREGLNDASNRLYQAKLKLLYAMDEMIKPDGHGPLEGAIVRKAKERVQALQALSAREPEVVKYNPRTAAVLQEAKEAKRESKKSEAEPTAEASEAAVPATPRIRRSFVLALLTAMVAVFFTQQRTQADLKQLKLPVSIVGVEQKEEGIILRVQPQVWASATRRTKDDLLRRLEAFLLANQLKQAEILTPKGTRLAALMSTIGDRGLIYGRRIYSR
jgi:CheY-like chemotaxis protein